MSVNYWAQFFKDAGIPSPVAKSYALIFDDNRISRDMLLDLNRDILSDMGIKVMGDSISILKHAKQVHSQEARRKDLGGGVSATSKATPPSKVPAAHSTSPGLAPPTVSTTTSNVKRRKPLVVSEVPADSWTPELAPVDQHEEEVLIVSGEEGEGAVDTDTLETLLSHPSLSQSDRMVLEAALTQSGLLPSDDVPISIAPPTDQEAHAGYTASASVKHKRPLTMYSDDPVEYSPPKHPRVVILPNKDKDIYTTTALKKAVATVTALGAASGLATTIPSSDHLSPEKLSQRRLLEATGLVEVSQREKSHTSISSVFSRLDQKPSTTTSDIRLPISSSKRPARVAVDTSKERTISAAGISAPTKTTLRITKPISKVRAAPSSSTSASRLSARLGGKEVGSRISSSTVQLGTLASDRLASRSGAPASTRDRLGVKEKEVTSSSTLYLTTGGGEAASYVSKPLSQRLGARAKESAVSGSVKQPAVGFRSGGTRVTQSKAAQEPAAAASTKHTMVADEYEYQTLRQLDVRSRLEKKERETRLRRGGPLAGRLAKHDIFGRLE